MSLHWKKLSAGKIPMPEAKTASSGEISEELLLARLAKSEQMREFFIQMWLQNPQLARQGGAKVQSLISPLAPLEERKKLFDSPG